MLDSFRCMSSMPIPLVHTSTIASHTTGAPARPFVWTTPTWRPGCATCGSCSYQALRCRWAREQGDCCLLQGCANAWFGTTNAVKQLLPGWMYAVNASQWLTRHLSNCLWCTQVKDSVDIDAARASYYTSLFPLNPSGIVPSGPRAADLQLGQPAGRGDSSSVPDCCIVRGQKLGGEQA